MPNGAFQASLGEELVSICSFFPFFFFFRFVWLLISKYCLIPCNEGIFM